MDRLPQLLSDLLDCAVERLTIKPCRSFVNPGFNAPWVSCEVNGEFNGQVWVAVRQMFQGWPSASGLPAKCNQLVFAAEIELGVTRCQVGQMDDQGDVDTDNISLDAAQQLLDRYELLQALVCCWEIEDLDIIYDRWETIEPSGGCVASRWIVRVRVGTCGCSS